MTWLVDPETRSDWPAHAPEAEREVRVAVSILVAGVDRRREVPGQERWRRPVGRG